jgi:hypothetical protein
METTQEFYRIGKLPPYVFAVINEMKAKARAANLDVVDLGMGNPDGATPRAIVSKLVEASRNQRNHRYSMSKGIPHLRQEIVKRYQANYGVTLDSERWRICCSPSSGRATRWCPPTPAIPSISTASSWRKATPARCPCRRPRIFCSRSTTCIRSRPKRRR